MYLYDRCESNADGEVVANEVGKPSKRRASNSTGRSTTRFWLPMLCILVLISLAIGILLGHFFTVKLSFYKIQSTSCNNSIDNNCAMAVKQQVGNNNKEHWYKGVEIQGLVNTEGLLKTFEAMSKLSKLAGSPESKLTTDYVYNFWSKLQDGDNGIDRVFKKNYYVPLTLMDRHQFNGVRVLNEEGKVLVESEGEIPLAEGDAVEGLYPAFSSFEPPIDIKGEAILAEDIDITKNGLQFNSTKFHDFIIIVNMSRQYDKIVKNLMRPKLFITFYQPSTIPNVPAYPYGQGMPNSSTMRSSSLFYLHNPGDPTTPLRPSKKDAVRDAFPDILYKVRENRFHVVYRDAINLIKALNFKRSPDCRSNSSSLWQCIRRHSKRNIVHIVRHTSTEIRSITNVCAIMLGSVEPDRYVLIGGHRDAWSAGVIDPTSGQAVMLESSAALVKLRQTTSWRPRRTMLFCSWDGEETGLYGSMEWIEEYYPVLRNRMVAYINTDCDVIGNWTLRSTSSSLITDAIFGLLNATADANNPNISLLEDMQHKGPRFESLHLDRSSDFFGFFHDLAVPSVDFVYDNNFNFSYFYPLYHTAYETLRALHFLDPGLRCHTAITKLTAATILTFCDSPLFPYNLSRFADEIDELDDVINQGLTKLKVSNVLLNRKLTAKIALQNSLRKFHKRLEQWNKQDSLTFLHQRQINDKLLQVEKVFLVRTDLLLFSPSAERQARLGKPVSSRTTAPRRVHLLRDYRNAGTGEFAMPFSNATIFVDSLINSYYYAREILNDDFSNG